MVKTAIHRHKWKPYRPDIIKMGSFIVKRWNCDCGRRKMESHLPQNPHLIFKEYWTNK